MDETPTIRPAARVVLLDRERCVLLLRAEFPLRSGDTHARVVWITPGGGVEPDESYEDAALRELREETGLDGVALGPCLWHRSHTFRFNERLIEQRERFYLVEVEGHEVTRHGHTEEELSFLTGHRWWSADEIRASDEIFAPRDIGAMFVEVLEHGAPLEPILVGR